MQQQTSHTTQSSVYPGEYTHLYEGIPFKRNVRKPTKRFVSGTSGKIEDLGDCYFVELPLPGIRKEEFVVETSGNILSVVVFQAEAKGNIGERASSSKIESTQSFIREVALPEDADLLFVSAQYKEGILSIYVPKSMYAGRRLNTQIAVY